MPFYGTQILKEFSKDFDNIIFQTFYVVWWIWNTFCTIVILNKKRRPFKAPISLRNLVRILTQNIRTQNTCYWISLCISSYYHSLQGWFCTYLMIKFIPQILRIVYNSQYWQYVCLFDANVLFFGYVQMFGSNSYTFSTHTIGI